MMSDPLSVAGSAVGIISLGLQVCGKIIKYSQDLRGQDDDLDRLVTKAEHLRAPLKELQDLIEDTRNESSKTADDLESKALGLQVYVERLKRKIEQYQPVSTGGAHGNGKARSTFKRAVYPFKKESLGEIAYCLDSMQMTLQTTLAISTARKLSTFESKQDAFDAKQDRILVLAEEMKTLQLAIQSSSPQRIRQLPPSQIRSWCDHLNNSKSLGLLPRAQKNSRAKQFRKSYSFCSRWLGFYLTGTFYLSTGSGGLSIAPSLKLCALVGPGSYAEQVFEVLSGLNPVELMEEPSNRIDEFIQYSQIQFSDGRAAPTDRLQRGPETVSMINIPFYYFFQCSFLEREQFPSLCRLTQYMLRCGATLDHQDNLQSCLPALCCSYLWTEEEYTFVSPLIERYGSINWAPRNWVEKANMQTILERYDDWIELPAAYIAVLRESEEDLKEILTSAAPHLDTKINDITLLQLAMGWPTGVSLLLEAESSAPLPTRYHRKARRNITDDDTKIGKYIESCKVLFEAGYTVMPSQIFDASTIKLQCVLLQELANRRRKLLDIAEAHIDPTELSKLRQGETGLPDAHSFCHYATLVAKGVNVNPSLDPGRTQSGLSIYHHTVSSSLKVLASLELLKKIYKVGFRDLDQTGPDGFTPLMDRCIDPSSESDLESIVWMALNGANLFRQIPGSNATAFHLLNAKLAAKVFTGYYTAKIGHISSYLRDKTCCIWQLDENMLSVSIKDFCSCSCSVGGCTAVSVAVRHVVYNFFKSRDGIHKLSAAFLQFLQYIVDFNQSDSEVCHAIIRSLTFDGLSLRHTCCTELHRWPITEHIRDESELREIIEEQKGLLEYLEELVAEFYARFDALNVPLIDFLKHVWYGRMVKFHSHRDHFDENHHREVRNLGISLEFDEVEIPLVIQLICDQERILEIEEDDGSGS
ncbi:hypothetical protein P170DRAFT_506431 [Aspergillus steynii IBT 23096]|uniref:Fungal N-terminal domain-containing protein n=1 Tax=Aspergillus steynii IBT 23096 TaxID=1392250 RepID=A0A2I2GST3_9EURO|nr:uncharacterized protein P170DRAFT_506431 [Aspergillus steynii IBT 23096]PLB55931.1 hypothetical protein P170DRAFT_506431 [Aspergillus steynii IBT 23096]